MVKILVVLLVALLVGQVTGASHFVPEESCCQNCTSEEPIDDSSPLCDSLPCCASPIFTTVAPLLDAGSLASNPIRPRPVAMHSTVHAREIFHVPKLSIA